MSADLNVWKEQLQTIIADLQAQANLTNDSIVVIGCSTSEVIGERIGTAGSMDVAQMIFQQLQELQQQTGVSLAFQCCEHLNRALVVEFETAKMHQLEMVSVIPVRSAGGAMATYAYHHLQRPRVVEFIKADAGIDIGDTFIGMHLKHVAVPLRSSQKSLGAAHVTMAKTRPKLIGGSRAVYAEEPANNSC